MDLFKRRKDGRLTQDEERWLLTEMLCILKLLVPVGEDFQKSLDTDFPATIGLLKDQAKAGMLNLVSHAPNLDKVFRENLFPEAGTQYYTDYIGEFDLRERAGHSRGEAGFYLLNTWIPASAEVGLETLPRWTALVYYDGDKNHTPSGTNSTIYALILSLHWLSESERVRSAVETVSLTFNKGEWTPGERDLTRIYYLGPTCPEEDSIGIINWMW